MHRDITSHRTPFYVYKRTWFGLTFINHLFEVLAAVRCIRVERVFAEINLQNTVIRNAHPGVIGLFIFFGDKFDGLGGDERRDGRLGIFIFTLHTEDISSILERKGEGGKLPHPSHSWNK